MINKIEKTAIINASIEKVFSFVSDFKRIPEWRNEVLGISQLSGSIGVGTTFCEDLNFMGKKQMNMKVLEFIQNKRIVIQALSGFHMLPTQSFNFKSDGNKTRIDLSVSMKVSGVFVIFYFMLPGMLNKMWGKYFTNMNRILSA